MSWTDECNNETVLNELNTKGEQLAEIALLKLQRHAA